MTFRPQIGLAQGRLRVRPTTATLLLLGACLTGCAGYSAAPLDPASHQAAFESRTPATPTAAEFARQLSRREGLAPGFDAADGLSLSESEVVALVFNAELRTARLRAGVAQAGADYAGLWDDPSIGVDVTRIIQTTTHPWKLAASIGLTLPISGRLEAEKRRAGVAHLGELARVAQAEWRTRIELRRAWARLAALGLRLSEQQAYLGRVGDVLGVVDAMEKAHELTRTEARLFRVEQVAGAMEVAQLRALLEDVMLDIKSLMGLAPSSDVRLVAGALADIGQTSTPTHEPIDTLISRACGPGTTSPTLAAARIEYELAERALALEVRKQYPDLHLGPGYGREDGQDQAMLGLSIPIPILNGNRRGIAEATAAREAARAQAEGVQERLAGDLARALVQLRGAGEQRRILEEQIVPMVDAQYADARATARLGEVNTLVLLESLKRQHDTMLQLIEAGLSEAHARIRLDELVGPPRIQTDPTTGGQP